VAEAAALSAQREQLSATVVDVQTEASDVAREMAKAEADVEAVRQRAARDQQRLDTGAVSSAKELESLQHELESLRRRQAALEDVELEVMERAEGLRDQLAELQRATAELDVALGEVTASRDADLAAIAASRAQATAQREPLAASLPTDLIALYDKLRADLGSGAAALTHGRCSGCRLELTPTELGRIRAAPAEEVVRCEECRRILVRLPDAL